MNACVSQVCEVYEYFVATKNRIYGVKYPGERDQVAPYYQNPSERRFQNV